MIQHIPPVPVDDAASIMPLRGKTPRESMAAAIATYRANAIQHEQWEAAQRAEAQRWQQSAQQATTDVIRSMEQFMFGEPTSTIGESEAALKRIVVQHKERMLDECFFPDVIDMQAAVWVFGGCPICRMNGTSGEVHRWETCPWHLPQRDAALLVKPMIDAIIRRNRQVGRPLEGACPTCNAPRDVCWVGRSKAGGCEYREVVTQAVAVILGANDSEVRDWEERQGQGDGGNFGELTKQFHDRYGCRAVWRMWRVFGWMGCDWSPEDVRVERYRSEYRKMWINESKKAGVWQRLVQ